MKGKIIFTFFLLALTSSINVFGQENATKVKTFDERELKSRRIGAGAALDNDSVRIIKKVYYFENGNETPKKVMKQIRELLPNKERSIEEIETKKGIVTEETIYIGNKIYTRRNKGRWIKPKLNNSLQIVGLGTPTQEEKTKYDVEEFVENKLTKSVKVNNQLTDCYETITTKNFKSDSKTYSETNRISYWISEKDKYIRIEEETINIDTKKRVLIVSDFEYDSKIKITAPIK